MAISFHPEAKKIKEILDKYKIQKLYHFTSIDNLSIIAKCGGLWSKEKLEKAGILSNVKTGGSEESLTFDKEFGNWNKIHLYFCHQTPMAYYKQQEGEHLCYILIDPVVALWDSVFFTDTNAARKQDGHKQKQGFEGIKLVDFETIRNILNGIWNSDKLKWKLNVQAEVLVPNEIPLNYIKSIVFISEASKKEGEQLWGGNPHLTFEVDENLFHRGFPYVKDAILTSKEVNKDNVNSESFEDMREFILGKDSKITMLVDLKAVPGLQTETIWKNGDNKEIYKNKTEFDKESDYWHWQNIGIERLNIGHWSVEYFIRETRWIKIHFTIGR